MCVLKMSVCVCVCVCVLKMSVCIKDVCVDRSQRTIKFSCITLLVNICYI